MAYSLLHLSIFLKLICLGRKTNDDISSVDDISLCEVVYLTVIEFARTLAATNLVAQTLQKHLVQFEKKMRSIHLSNVTCAELAFCFMFRGIVKPSV